MLINCVYSSHNIVLCVASVCKWVQTVVENHIDMKTRKRIIKAYVWSTLLYGCETWTITTRNVTKLQSFEM